MKQVLAILILITAYSCAGQDKGHFGGAVNTSITDVSISFAPTVTYLKRKHQLELGLGLHPFTSNNVRTLSGEFNYKYFPNGVENRFNMYFTSNFTHINRLVNQGLDTRDNYLILTGGYGFQLRFFKTAYIGTNVNIGWLTRGRSSEDLQYTQTQNLFENYYWSAAIRFNIGYRF